MSEVNPEIRAAMAARLLAAREAAGWKSRKAAADRFGFNVNTCKSHENGIRTFGRDDAERYASAYHSSVPHLMADDMRTTSPYHAMGRTFPAESITNNKFLGRKPLPPVEEDSGTEGTDPDSSSVPGVPPFVPPAVPRLEPPAKAPQDKVVPGPAFDHDHTTVPVIGSIAYGLWLAEGGPVLHEADAQVPRVPGEGEQYARQVIGDEAGDGLRAGDFVVFSRLSGGRPPKGRVDVGRKKGRLHESSLWISDGRSLRSEASRDEEAVDFDPDDPSFVVEGVAIAVYRRL